MNFFLLTCNFFQFLFVLSFSILYLLLYQKNLLRMTYYAFQIVSLRLAFFLTLHYLDFFLLFLNLLLYLENFVFSRLELLC